MPTIHGTLTSTGTLTGNIGYALGSSDYEALTNLPQINSVLVIGNKSLDAYGIQPTNDYADNSDILNLFRN